MSGEPRASPRAGRERGPRSAAPERRAVAAALAASRPRRHRGAELAGEPLAKGERTRVYTAYRADRWGLSGSGVWLRVERSRVGVWAAEGHLPRFSYLPSK